MLRKILLTLTALVAVILPLTLASAPANAALGDNRCITKAEFRAIAKGQTITRVHNITDFAGSQWYYDSGYPGAYGWPASQEREYRQCGSSYGSAYVEYERVNGVWKMTFKSAYWG